MCLVVNYYMEKNISNNFSQLAIKVGIYGQVVRIQTSNIYFVAFMSYTATLR